jgi:hypothetical protein
MTQDNWVRIGLDRITDFKLGGKCAAEEIPFYVENLTVIDEQWSAAFGYDGTDWHSTHIEFATRCRKKPLNKMPDEV